MLNYEEIKNKLIKENMKLVIKQYKNPDFQEKIIKYCKKFGIDKSEIEERIKKMDIITLSIFAKDPSKQNFYEKTAANFIKKIKGVKNFVNLPTTGKNSLYVDKDNIRKRSDFIGDLPSKNIDFKWKFSVKEIKYYAFHKYINESGGAQDNQFNDVLKSIVAARSNVENFHHYILFICDGKYFTNSKIRVLKNAITNKNHEVLKIDELENYLNKNK